MVVLRLVGVTGVSEVVDVGVAGFERSVLTTPLDSSCSISAGRGEAIGVDFVYDCDVAECVGLSVHGDDDVTRTEVGVFGYLTAGIAVLTKDGGADHVGPAAASVLAVQIVLNTGENLLCYGVVAAVVPVAISSLVVPDSVAGILALDVLQHSLDVSHGDILAIGQLTGSALVVIVAGVLVLAIVVLIVVLIAGVVVVDQLEHPHDDGASLGTGHAVAAGESAIGHAGQDVQGVAVAEVGLLFLGHAAVVLDSGLGFFQVGAGGAAVLAGDDNLVVEHQSHVVTAHVGVFDSEAVAQAGFLSSLGVGIVPLGAGGSLDALHLGVEEGAGHHDDELHVSHLVIGLEGAIGEALDDAELGALGHIAVVPGGGLDVLEAGGQRQVVLGNELAVSGEGGSHEAEAHNQSQEKSDRTLEVLHERTILS